MPDFQSNAGLPESGGRDGSGPVPEPGALFLVGTGLLGVALTTRLRRRKQRRKQQ